MFLVFASCALLRDSDNLIESGGHQSSLVLAFLWLSFHAASQLHISSFSMTLISKALTYVACCFRSHPPDDEEFSSNLNTLQARSAVSVHLPANTVPHASSKPEENATDDGAALREIFRSSSSVRGYQTASQSMHLPAPRPSSFDVDFKFGSKDSEKKPPGRLEQLGSHIKQRISEGGLSKRSSRGQMVQPDAEGHTQNVSDRHPSPLGTNHAEASMSQRSTGLLELLMSRTGSEGGYDSDAKSIQTTMLKAPDSPVKLNPGVANPPLNSLDIPVPACPSPHGSRRGDVRPGDEVGKASIDHEPPTIPVLTIFAEALLAEKDSAPTVALQRLSTGVSNGTIKLPSSCDINGPHDHATMKENESAHGVCSSSTELGCSIEQQTDILCALKRLSNTVVAVQRDSLVSTHDDEIRASIVSNLDPTFIKFISKFAELDPSEIAPRSSDPDGDPGTNLAGGEFSSIVPTFSTLCLPDGDDRSARELRSRHDSDQASVHLYNMRISQNLASPSLVAVTSRPTTSHTTISQSKRPSLDVAISSKRQSAASHLSSRVTTEHNRRPSDPQTRRLFEEDHHTTNMHSQWKTVASFNSGVSELSSKPIRVGGDDGSSFCWSDGELGPINHCPGEPPKRNTHSFAIAGRSESVSLLASLSMNSMVKVSETEEGTWFGRNLSRGISGRHRIQQGNSQRSRSTSMPERAGLAPLQPAAQRPDARRTEDDERLSEISTGALEDAKRENLTEISAQAVYDSRNERMSEIHHSTPLETTNWNFSFGNAVSSDRRRSSNISAHSLDTRTHWQRRKPSSSGTTHDPGSSEFLESATDMWQRSFRRAAAEPLDETVGRFLTAPRYDRNGRRRKSKASSGSNTDRDEFHNTDQDGFRPTGSHSRAHSEDFQLASSPGIEGEIPQAPLHPMVNNNKRKKSFLDIGRRFTGTISKESVEIRPGTVTPLKDIFGL